MHNLNFKHKKLKCGLVGFALLLFSVCSYAQILVDEGTTNESSPSEPTKVGKEAATDYFKARENRRVARREDDTVVERHPDSSHGGDRYLTIHFGTFVNDKAYRWGQHSSDSNVGGGMLGVTYRVGEWKSSMDLLLRAELMAYDIDSQHPVKLSLMPIIAFPDSRSDFPVYFGAGAGPGIFFNQVSGASDLSLDYALLIGGRFAHVFGENGLFLETGLKGQFFLLSEGQQQGIFIAAGGVFVF
jgi:hypothetical protein